jgi:hypothetical protein
MNPFEMVVALVAIGAFASILRAKYGVRKDRHGNETIITQTDPDAGRMREEIKTLKDRVAVLERLITDTNSAASLDREIEKLR